MNVVIVDQNNAIKKALFEVFEDDFINIVAELPDGHELLNVLQGTALPDFIFVNADLRDKSGTETVRQAVRLYRDLKVVGVSFSDERGNLLEIIAAGARNIITSKDFCKSKLEQKLFSKN